MVQCCQKKCARCVFITLGCVFITIGAVFALFWGTLYNGILNRELVLTNTSRTYEFWKETPIPMYLKVYLFNWTNAKEVVDSKWAVKPVLDQKGPYVFYEHHIREDVVWNQNDTVTFRQRMLWRFEPSLSIGTLSDNITNINPVGVVIGSKVKDMPFVIREGINVAFQLAGEKLYITKTVDELLFSGYHDKIIDTLHEFNISLPFDKFGWFYQKNNSVTYDGYLTMHTGKTNLSLLGELTLWNGAAKTPAYTNSCSEVKGTTGELWHPVKSYEEVQIFVPDVCGSLPFNHNGSESTCSISGKKFVGTDFAFDNGTKYPEQACYTVKKTIPSGLRDASQCKLGAPAFISYPHFYLADPSYSERIVGMKPNKSEHETFIILEDLTGIPLNVKVQLQINIFLEAISNISIFSNIKPTYMPTIWFTQTATLTEEYCKLTHLLVSASVLGSYLGWTVFGLGLVFSVIGFIMLYHRNEVDELHQQLIEEEAEE